jgi:hypothetical protein
LVQHWCAMRKSKSKLLRLVIQPNSDFCDRVPGQAILAGFPGLQVTWCQATTAAGTSL